MAEINLGKVKLTDAELETKIQEVITNMGGTGGSSSGGFTVDVLWENANVGTQFASQRITLSHPLSDYNFWMVNYVLSSVITSTGFSTGLILPTKNTMLFAFMTGTGLATRGINKSGEDALNVSGGYTWSTFTSSKANDIVLIPQQVLGVK